MIILFSAIPKDILIYLDQMNIYLFKPVEIKHNTHAYGNKHAAAKLAI